MAKARTFPTIGKAMGCSVLAIVAAGAAQAQDVYGSVGIGYLKYDTGNGFSALDAMVGVKWASGKLAYGVEADFLKAAPGGDNFARLRGVISADMDNFTLFAAAGRMWTINGSYSGHSVGIGAEIPFNNNATVRVQADRNTLGLASSTDVLVGVEIRF